MPGVDGLRLCRFIKRRFPDSCITGMSGSRGEKAFKNAGADVCLSKPFSIDDLRKAVENCGHFDFRGRRMVGAEKADRVRSAEYHPRVGWSDQIFKVAACEREKSFSIASSIDDQSRRRARFSTRYRK